MSFEKMLMVKAGQPRQEIETSRRMTAREYFSSINLLNESALTYGVVYLASPEALEALDRIFDQDFK